MAILATVQLHAQARSKDAVARVVRDIVQAVGKRTVDMTVVEQGVLRVELVLVEHAPLLERVGGVAGVSVARTASH